MYLYAYICGTEGDRWIGSERRFLEGTRETADHREREGRGEEKKRERETRSVYSFNTRAGEGGQKRSAKGMRRERKRRIASAGV